MRKTWSIMRRDLLKLGRNPLTIFTSVLLPIIYLVIFGNSFQGVLKHLPVVIVSEDNGPYAIRVMEQMQALAAGPKTIAITYKSDAGAALQDVRDGVYKAALIIPPGFSHAIAEGRIGELGLFTDNVDTISAATLTGVISQATAVDPRRLRHRARAQARPDRDAPEQPVHDRRLRPLADSGRDRDGAVHGFADLRRIQLGDGPFHGHHRVLPGDAAVALEPRRAASWVRACW